MLQCFFGLKTIDRHAPEPPKVEVKVAMFPEKKACSFHRLILQSNVITTSDKVPVEWKANGSFECGTKDNAPRNHRASFPEKGDKCLKI